MFLMAATGCKWHWRIDQGNELEAVVSAQGFEPWTY